MSNREKYIDIFEKLFNVKGNTLLNSKYQGISKWDSVGHMRLIAELEYVFNIEIDTEDILALDSFEHGIKILNEKYNISI